MKCRTVAIIPAYNEGAMIGSVVESLCNRVTEVVVVDDCSRDTTVQHAYEAGATVLRHLVNRGQGAALATGTAYALKQDADIIVHFDADGQHSPEDIQKFVVPLTQGNVDVVLGSRFLAQSDSTSMPLPRRVLLKCAIAFTSFFSGIRLTDTHNGFRALSRRAAELIRIRENRMAHASEIIHEIAHHRLRVREVPVAIRYTDYSFARMHGAGDHSLKRSIDVLARLVWTKLIS